jgi:hypothetical protein
MYRIGYNTTLSIRIEMKFCNPAFLRSPGPACETLSMCLVSSLPSPTGFTSRMLEQRHPEINHFVTIG